MLLDPIEVDTFQADLVESLFDCNESNFSIFDTTCLPCRSLDFRWLFFFSSRGYDKLKVNMNKPLFSQTLFDS